MSIAILARYRFGPIPAVAVMPVVRRTSRMIRAFQGYTGQTDVLLLGPQLGHRFESLKEQYESKGIRIDRIDPERFGAMDAKAVLEQAFPDLSGQIGDK